MNNNNSESTNHSKAENYVFNYNEDIAMYGEGRGYDSTVWQKTYVNNVEKYVMIAELNSVVPSFEVSADAPSMIPIAPHFDSASTNVHYTLHTQPQWGFRTKAASPEIEGKTFSKTGIQEDDKILLSSDSKLYPSDKDTIWSGSFYDVNENETTNRYFNSETGAWEDTESNSLAAAIYFNEKGFDPKVTTYSKDWIDENPNNWDGENNIDILATGYSGKKYNSHLENHAKPTPQIDTLELSVMLPAIGDSIAEMWDLVYGNREQNEGNERNLDVFWE